MFFSLFSSSLFFFFFDFPPAKRVLSTRPSKSPEIYHKKTFFSLKRVRICNFSPAARTACNPPPLDMQPFPHIHAPLRPTDLLVVAVSSIYYIIYFKRGSVQRMVQEAPLKIYERGAVSYFNFSRAQRALKIRQINRAILKVPDGAWSC
jgi:hypothetical protein